MLFIVTMSIKNILQESYIIHNVISVFAKEEITITIAHMQGFWNSYVAAAAETFGFH